MDVFLLFIFAFKGFLVFTRFFIFDIFDNFFEKFFFIEQTNFFNFAILGLILHIPQQLAIDRFLILRYYREIII